MMAFKKDRPQRILTSLPASPPQEQDKQGNIWRLLRNSNYGNWYKYREMLSQDFTSAALGPMPCPKAMYLSLIPAL